MEEMSTKVFGDEETRCVSRRDVLSNDRLVLGDGDCVNCFRVARGIENDDGIGLHVFQLVA